MENINELVKLAVDGYHGNVEKYSIGQSQDLIKEALIKINNGKTTINYKDIRDGKCPGLFAFIEEVIARTVEDGIVNNEFFNTLVDYRNVAEGDENRFLVEDSNLFAVAETAKGTLGIRRQRLGDVTEVPVPTTFKMVRIYEEMNRVLSGRVDFNYFIGKVSESFRQKLLDDIYGVFSALGTSELGSAYYVDGKYDEDEMLDLIAHTEAAAGGRKAMIIGTGKAVRNLVPSIISDGAKEDLYKMGHFGNFFGTPVIAVPQRHKVGTTEFALDDNVLAVVATDEKPIKVVREGNPIVSMRDPFANADLTNEYYYGEGWGVGFVIGGYNPGIGVYNVDNG